MARNSDKIEIRKIDEIIPYINNPRHNKEAVDLVAASISEFGFKNPIILDSKNVIVAGHTRFAAAKKLGLKEVPCIMADDLTEQQIKAFRLADNKVAEAATWDMDLLKIELDGITDIDMSNLGFGDISLGDEIGEGHSDVNEDDVPEKPDEPNTKVGDIYQLGKHRLICGDSTKRETFDALMDGHKAKILFTSPPYSDMREYNGGKNLDVGNVVNFISACRDYTDYQCVNLGIKRKDNEVVQYWDEYIAKAKECGYKLLSWNVWDKMTAGSMGMQDAMFPIIHEWIFVFGTERYETNLTVEKRLKSAIGKTNTNTKRNKDGSTIKRVHRMTDSLYKKMESVIQVPPENDNAIRQSHPAVFPVALPSEYIQSMTHEGDIVIEPFCGSGTTLIACEQLDRICYGVELDPAYCDVIVKRWEKMTGKKAQKIKG